MTSTDLVMAGSYDYRFVVLSAVIAFLTSYTALDLAARLTAAVGRLARLVWLVGGATGMGIGIWSMHYIGMLAFSLPVPVQYDWPTGFLSLLTGILSSGLALFVVSRQRMGWLPALSAGLFMGGGIATLHYTWMAAMRLRAMHHYSPGLATLSVVFAVVFSLLALWLTFLFRNEASGRKFRKIAGAALMGAAICAVYYTAMAAATFTRSDIAPDLSRAVGISSRGTAGIACVALIVLGIALLTSLADRLQKQKALLDELFEQAPQAVALLNMDDRIVRVNREFIRMFGYTPQESAGRRLADLIVPQESRGGVHGQPDVPAHGRRVDAEGVRRRKDDSRLLVSMIHVPVSTTGEKIATYAIYRDITERKRADEARRASEERWRSIFENSAVGIALMDPESCHIAANRAYQEMVGYSDNELRKLSYLDITYEDDRQSSWASNVDLWQGKLQQFRHEKRCRRKDGNLIWVRNTVSLAAGSETVPRFALAIVEDITEHKQAEEQLRRSEAYLAESQRRSHVGTWVFTVAPRAIVFWSQEHYRIFGFDPGKGMAAFQDAINRIHPKDRPGVDRAIETAIQEKRDFDVDYRIVLPDGTRKYCHAVGHPVLNETGDVVAFTGTAMDVTERKQAEKQLLQSFTELRALTARLQNVREEERTRVAREIHDQLGQALTAIKIDLASLIREPPGAQKPVPQKIERILNLVDETIQSVRRISTDLRPGILDDLGLVAAVEWAAEEFQTRTGTKCQVSLPEMDVDMDPEHATALFRIFQETLTNVARHAHATEVNVRLVKENGDLSMEVRDNGTGISDSKLAAGQSLGILGMRERALLLGGEFTIRGVPGKGTTVRARIPKMDQSRIEQGK